jgi:hypothetical protein
MNVALDLTVDLDLTLGPPKLFERRARDRFSVGGLLVVKAACKSNRSCDDNCASE